MRKCFEIHLVHLSFFVWTTLCCVWLCAQMSLVRTWAGGRPALCLWSTDQHLPESNPPDLSLHLRGRGCWKLPAWPSWTALTLMSVWMCVCVCVCVCLCVWDEINLKKWCLACVEQIIIELFVCSLYSGWDCWPQISQQLECGYIFDGWYIPRVCSGEEKWVRNYF